MDKGKNLNPANGQNKTSYNIFLFVLNNCANFFLDLKTVEWLGHAEGSCWLGLEGAALLRLRLRLQTAGRATSVSHGCTVRRTSSHRQDGA